MAPRAKAQPLPESWHLDKRVNVSIIGALLAQAAVALTWANHLSYDVAEVKKDITTMSRQAEMRDAKLDVVIELKTLMTVLAADISLNNKTNRESFRRLWDVTRKIRTDMNGQKVRLTK